MNKILLDEKYILEYIKDILNDLKLRQTIINDRYHHNSSYKDASSICKHGILSMQKLNDLGITNYTKEFLDKMNDIESHINGKDKVSLSVVGLSDLYKDEFEYNPYNPNFVDFVVSNEIKARRSNFHYGNEFLADSINIDKIKSVDIRILQLIDEIKSDSKNIQDIIDKYNYLKDIGKAIKQFNLDIPLREMSSNFDIDIDKLSNNPKVLKKY